jgi:hypothetical protein
MVIKGKTKELLYTQLKTCERNMEEFNSIKRTNLRIMGIEEGEDVQAKGICNIIQQNNNRKFPKSRENYAHSGTRSLQNRR